MKWHTSVHVGRLRESHPEGRAMFSRAPYRYTGRTLYQTQNAAAQTNRNPQFSRSAGGHVAGSRSMDNRMYLRYWFLLFCKIHSTSHLDEARYYILVYQNILEM